MTETDTPTILLVCTHRRLGSAGSCGGAGGESLADALRLHVAERGLGWIVRDNTCLGHCQFGPNVKAAGGPMLHGCANLRADEVIARLLSEWHPPKA